MITQNRSLFYAESEASLRFGDVLKGFISVSPKIKEPFSGTFKHDYKIQVEMPSFSVVMTPCCSIGENKISLAPLIPVRKSFYENKYFAEDLTRINRVMERRYVLSEDKFKSKSPEEQAEILSNDNKVYTLLDLFIYDKNDIYDEYNIKMDGKNEAIKYYMVDFKTIQKIDCEEVKSSRESPLSAKCLQLSISARNDLRNKMAYYYGRIPDEDKGKGD